MGLQMVSSATNRSVMNNVTLRYIFFHVSIRNAILYIKITSEEHVLEFAHTSMVMFVLLRNVVLFFISFKFQLWNVL